MANIKVVGGVPGATFHIHGGHAMELDHEGVFNPQGEMTIAGLNPEFYSVGHMAWSWLDPPPGSPPDFPSFSGGLSLPRQIRAGDTIDIGGLS